MRLAFLMGLSWLLLALQGCADSSSHTRGVYMLLDTSGTYTQELEKAQGIIRYLLVTLQPGDSMAVARIDSGSFSEKDIVAKVTFDSRPSVANAQKRAFSEKIEKFVKTVQSSPYTDISGGLLQAAEFLQEVGSPVRTVLIFSDLKEELPKGHVRDFELPLEDHDVVALNVTKLRSDIMDPKEYLSRVEKWRAKVESSGGRWRMVNDLDNLERMFEGS